MNRAARILLFVACVIFGIGSFYNVLVEEPEVERLAAAAACAGAAGCNAQKTRESRSPIARSFAFAIGKRSVEVRCTRALIFAGGYSCAAP